ncbi:MAG TPA: VapC toxin family PIN domain ribonuclease, partial [Candidatus Thermoplasmatota archaeon]
MGEVIDTGVLAAAFHKRDTFHLPSLNFLKQADSGQRPPVHLHDFVLAETLNFLVRKAGSPTARIALDRIESSPAFIFNRITDEEFVQAKNEEFRRVE